MGRLVRRLLGGYGRGVRTLQDYLRNTGESRVLTDPSNLLRKVDLGLRGFVRSRGEAQPWNPSLLSTPFPTPLSDP